MYPNSMAAIFDYVDCVFGGRGCASKPVFVNISCISGDGPYAKRTDWSLSFTCGGWSVFLLVGGGVIITI